jgi:RsiW-degrading membrane proteinase PrsW (M82 family)
VKEKGMEFTQKKKAFGWFKVLLAGGLFYFASLIILIITGNPNLFPTVVLIGNFLVPVAYVAFFYERRHISLLNMPITAYTFLYGGLIGVLASSILEPIFVRPMNPTSVLTVGIIEEAAKILGVIIIARRIQVKTEMDGLILGAAAGMGFAALESLGYAFTAFLESGGSLTAVVYTTMLRGILSPVGHGTWTAILAGVLFRESRQGHFRINGKVFLAFLGVALLHALWDGLPALIDFLFSSGIAVFIAQTIIGGIGFLVLWLRWREALRLQIRQLSQPEALIIDNEKPVEEAQ